MITSKITGKARTTIPQAVRIALRIKAGDEIAYAIEGDRVILTKTSVVILDNRFTTFIEWDSEADRRAYGKL
ncbi:MAG TPA: type II toxin-antitoxin system PrlF family antitoxin [Stellaceae bacterium]